MGSGALIQPVAAWRGMAGLLAVAVAGCPFVAQAQDLVAPGAATGLSPGLRISSGEDDVRCLTLAVAYEAGNQSVAGQEAVAEVVLNRTRHPAFPRSVCGVVFQGWTRQTGCQFTFTCDGSLQRRLPGRVMTAAQAVAARVLAGDEAPRVAGALNYHANYVSPRWASQLDRVATIGAHIFYRPVPGGRPENGRSPEQGLTSGDAEGMQAIRQYARIFDGTPAPVPVQPVARIAASVAGPSQPFMPWGLNVR